MKSEHEMYTLIINVARHDERIRAVLLCGSRADSEAPPDEHQDYDIIYFVNDVREFYNNKQWAEGVFGKCAIMQMPDICFSGRLEDKSPDYTRFAYLMLFPDGTRIDLTVQSAEYTDNGEPARVLLDKDGMLCNIAPNKSHWHVRRPSEKQFSDCCNEFWWCLNNVAKGIARDEMPYAMQMYNVYVRDMLQLMLEWYIGGQTGYSVSAGKCGKYFKKYLPKNMYAKLLKTYCEADYISLWQAVYTMCELFSAAAKSIAAAEGFIYLQADEDGIINYINCIKNGN